MAVDRTGDDRPALERPQRSGGRPRERLSCLARNGRFSAQGKKTIRPLRMPIEPNAMRRSLVRHAPSRPQWTCQWTGSRITANGIILVMTNGNGCIAPTARIEWSEPTTACGRLPRMEHCSPSLSGSRRQALMINITGNRSTFSSADPSGSQRRSSGHVSCRR